MTQPAPEPLPAEPSALVYGLCADRTTAEELRAGFDSEHGYPKRCRCADGSEPPPGVPCTILHALEIEPVERDKDGSPTSWVHPLPRAALPPAVAAKVEAKTRTEIAELKAAQPELPDVVPDIATERTP